jgi:hypothetical protein
MRAGGAMQPIRHRIDLQTPPRALHIGGRPVAPIAPPPPAPRAPSRSSASPVLDDLAAGEPSFSLPKAANYHLFRVNGRGPNASTVWRWHKTGARSASGGNVVLETARVGGTIVTTPSAISRFLHRCSDPAATAGMADVTPGQSKREHQAAGKQLDAIGLR